jgi:tetratricopeptide (TPR) repeat protein
MTQDNEPLEINLQNLLRRAPPTPAMAPEARARVLQAIREKHAAMGGAEILPIEGRRAARRREAAMLGAVALAAGMLGLFVGGGEGRGRVVHANDGLGAREIVLRDGTRVTLDRGAAIEERGARSVRVVRGDVIFDVAKPREPAGSPFRVAHGGVQLVALGTQFLVESGADETRVAVARGRVELTSASGVEVVGAGEEGVVSKDGVAARRRAKRMSHLFGFSRRNEASGEAARPEGEVATASPRRRGTLIARDPRWGGERPLEIRDFTVDVRIEDGVARTTIDQTFFNPDVRQLEGVYGLELPAGAAISRLGMYVDGELMEAAVVDRDRGRNIYEGIVYQRRDPALLEWMAGNSFKMRVFPLPARTEKRIFLSYTQTLEHLYDTDRLVVPVPPVDQPADKVRFAVRIAGAEGIEVGSPSHPVTITDDGADRLVTFDASAHTLGRDFVLTMRKPGAEVDGATVRSFKETGARYVSVRVQPDLLQGLGSGASRESLPRRRRWVLLFDTSGSRAEDALAAQRTLAHGILDDVDDDDEVAFVALDRSARVMPGGLVRARTIGPREIDAFLGQVGRGGDTRLDAGLRAAADLLGAGAAGAEDVVVYLGDGIVTGGATAPADLARSIPSGARFVGLAVGDSTDLRLLGELADASGGLHAAVGTGEDLSWRAFDLVSTLRVPCLRNLRATVTRPRGEEIAGASARLLSRRVCDGERVDVVARVSGAQPVVVKIEGRSDGGEAFERSVVVDQTAPRAGYLPRMWAQREVDALLLEPASEERRQKIVALGIEHVLTTPHTSLLVLENDAMYRELGVEKREARGWAVYDAPKRIPVRFEPRGTDAIAVDGSWDFVHRLPTRYFEAPAWLDSMGTIGQDARGPRVRMGSAGTGSGFGAGGGRLGGAHRDRVVTTAGPRGAEPASEVPRRALAQNAGLLPMSAPVSALTRTDRNRAGGWMNEPDASVRPGLLDLAVVGGAPAAFASSSDPRLDDLTELMPALTTTPADLLADFLAAATSAPPARDPEALDLLARAGAAQREVSYRIEGPRGHDGRLSVGSGSSTVRERMLASGVTEIVRYDGKDLVASYSELGVAVRRKPGSAAPWILASEVPFVVPAVSATEGLHVELAGPRTIRISAPSQPAADDSLEAVEALEIDLDDALRPVQIRWLIARSARRASIEHVAGAVIVRLPSGQKVRFVEDGGKPVDSPRPAVTVDVPTLAPARIDERLKRAAQGSEEWTALQRQRLVAAAALGNEGMAVSAIREIYAARRKVERGEIVLASRGLRHLGDAEVTDAVGSLPAGDPLREMVLAARASDATAKREAFAGVAKRNPGTALGMWGAYRAALGAAEDTAIPQDKIVEVVSDFGRSYSGQKELRYLLVKVAADRHRYTARPVARKLWESLSADPDLALLADREIALLDPWQNPEESSTLLARSFDRALELGLAPSVDWQTRSILHRARGEVGYDLFWSRWRRHVTTHGNAAQLASFISALAQGLAPTDRSGIAGGGSDDVGALLARFEAADDVDDRARMGFARLLVSMGRLPEAERVLAPLLDAPAPLPDVLDLGALVARERGQLDEAAGYLRRVIALTERSPVDMAVARARYRDLVDIHVRRSLAPSPGKVALVDVFGAVEQWRREDPDNADVDLYAAAALYQLGLPEEAERQIYSVIDRRPGEGESWSVAATAIEKRGDFDRAAELWDRAIGVESTNPTWLVRKGQLLRARQAPGDDRVARELFRRVADGKWQGRFSPAVHEARSALAAMSEPSK